MRTLTSIILIFNCLSITTAQWTWEDPLPQGHNLVDVYSEDGSAVWAAGSSATLLYHDGTDSLWERREISPEAVFWFNDIAPLGAEDIWIIGTNYGNQSRVYHFDGQQWALEAELNGTLTDAYRLAPDNGWVVGNNGLIVHYDGINWIPVASGTTEWLFDIFFTDANNGWAVGKNGTILFFNGTEWTQQSSPTNETILEVWVTSPNEGWAIAQDQKLLHFDGATWSEYLLTFPFQPYTLFFLDENTGWAAGEGGNIWKYSNGNWVVESTLSNQNFTGIWMTDENTGWAVGGYETLEKINGVWNSYSKSADYENQHVSIDMLNENEGWVVGDNGMILRKNGGDWKKYPSPTNKNLWDVFFLQPDEGWCVGKDGIILQYTDATGWQTFLSPVSTDLSEVFFTQSDDGWAVGKDGVILHYNGTQWTQVPSPTTNYLYNLYFFDSEHGWAVGQNGTILQYLYGDWSVYTSPVGNYLNSVVQTSETDGWITGLPNILLRFDGTDWNSVTPPPLPSPGDIPCITCPEPDLCYLLPFNRNYIYQWKDNQWNKITQPGIFTNRRADFINADVGFFIGFLQITKFNAAGLVGTDMPENKAVLIQPQVFPNPAKSSLNTRIIVTEPMNLEIRLLSTLGAVCQTLLHERVDPGEHLHEHFLADISAGIYFLEFTSEKMHSLQKVIIR